MTPLDDKQSPIKSKPLRLPGQSLDKEIEIIHLKRFRNISIFLMIVAIAIYELLHAYLGVPPQPILAISLVIISGIYLYFCDDKLRKEAKCYEQGSLGEKIVGEELENLKQEGCKIFHDITINSANFNIDHVILSKHGIFAVETKTISKPKAGEISSNGKVVFYSEQNPDKKPIEQAVNNARSLRSYLKDNTGRDFQVQPVLVYPGWYVKDYTDSKIWVLNPKVLRFKIDKQPENMIQADYDKAELYLSALCKQ